ncbi:STAS domain-containing protein [Geodermatophilus sp. SYSU D00758]
MPHLHTALVPAPDQVVVRLTGDADLSTLDRLTAALEQAAGLGTASVVVDVAGAHFWDCSGLHALTAFTAALAPAGRQCRIVGAPAATRRLVRVSGLEDRLTLDGPLRGHEPVRPAPVEVPGVPPAQAAGADRAPLRRGRVPGHGMRALRRAEDTGRRSARLDALRRWR